MAKLFSDSKLTFFYKLPNIFLDLQTRRGNPRLCDLEFPGHPLPALVPNCSQPSILFLRKRPSEKMMDLCFSLAVFVFIASMVPSMPNKSSTLLEHQINEEEGGFNFCLRSESMFALCIMRVTNPPSWLKTYFSDVFSELYDP